jgi:hypothetical protein
LKKFNPLALVLAGRLHRPPAGRPRSGAEHRARLPSPPIWDGQVLSRQPPGGSLRYAFGRPSPVANGVPRANPGKAIRSDIRHSVTNSAVRRSGCVNGASSAPSRSGRVDRGVRSGGRMSGPAAAARRDRSRPADGRQAGRATPGPDRRQSRPTSPTSAWLPRSRGLVNCRFRWPIPKLSCVHAITESYLRSFPVVRVPVGGQDRLRSATVRRVCASLWWRRCQQRVGVAASSTSLAYRVAVFKLLSNCELH